MSKILTYEDKLRKLKEEYGQFLKNNIYYNDLIYKDFQTIKIPLKLLFNTNTDLELDEDTNLLNFYKSSKYLDITKYEGQPFNKFIVYVKNVLKFLNTVKNDYIKHIQNLSDLKDESLKFCNQTLSEEFYYTFEDKINYKFIEHYKNIIKPFFDFTYNSYAPFILDPDTLINYDNQEKNMKIIVKIIEHISFLDKYLDDIFNKYYSLETIQKDYTYLESITKYEKEIKQTQQKINFYKNLRTDLVAV